MSINIGPFDFNDFLTKFIQPLNDARTQVPVCGPNETLHGDLMFPEHYSCIPHAPIPDPDPGMMMPYTPSPFPDPDPGMTPHYRPGPDPDPYMTVPREPFPGFYEFFKSLPYGPYPDIHDFLWPEPREAPPAMPQLPKTLPWDTLMNEMLSHLMENIDLNELLAMVARRMVCEHLVIGLLIILGVSSKI